MVRRRATACALVLIFCFAAVCAAGASDQLTVKTDKGKVRGKVSADGQVRIFLGIPYAAPPVGSLRWRPPQPAAKWPGVREATGFGHRCMQTRPFEDMVFRDPGASEDCLDLNVWTPTKNKHAKLPVMVWIYGGGFTGGASSEPRQDGEHLAHKGVVVVSMNYRLGIFGFFVSPQLVAESAHHAAGNYGLMDQTAALEWVKRNIGRFGGDPHNVTIFGESAGSESVSAQMASPLAQGLFARAIGESGGAFLRTGTSFAPLARREQTDAAFAAAVLGTADVAGLRAMSADEILEKITAHGTSTPCRPDIDGWFLPESVDAIYRQGKQAHVPLLAGWNRDEPSALGPPTPAIFHAQIERDFGANADAFLRLFPTQTDAEAVRSAIFLRGAQFITYSTWKWLELQAATGDAPVYRYYFRRPSPPSKYHPAGSGAFHSDEIEYVFGTLDSRPGAVWQPGDYQLSDLIETYWTNFARTGNPNTRGTPDWPAYTSADDWQVMNLDAQSAAAPDPHRDRWLFLDRVWSHRPQL